MSALAPFVLEAGLGLLLLLVFVAGLLARGEDRRGIAWLATGGVLVLGVVAMFLKPAGAGLGGMFVQDGLAIFAKRVFLAATFIGLLAGLSLTDRAFARRAAEYHLLLLSSLLGMLVLASARDLILLFLAFELMSIPLYVLAGFLKQDATAVEASLKFFLVGSVSSAVMVYGLSFMYGAAGSTDLAKIAAATAGTDPLLTLGLVAALVGFAFKIAAFPFHMWVPDTYEAASTPFVAWLSVAPKAAGFVAVFRVYFEGTGERAAAWMPAAALLATVTMLAGNLMALPQQNTKRLLAYSGIAQIGYMLVGLVGGLAVRHRHGALLPGRVRLRQHGRVPRGGGAGPRGGLGGDRARSAASPSALRCSRWRCCSSCSRSAASRSWPASGPSSTSSGRRRSAASTGWSCWAPSSPSSRSSTTCWSPSACTSRRLSDPARSTWPPRLPCRSPSARSGSSSSGFIRRRVVMAALRVAAPLF